MLKSHFFDTFNSKLIIISSILCFILSNIFSESVQNVAIMTGILTFGVIHGANDVILLNKNLEKPALNSRYLILLYSLMVLLSAIFFFYFSVIALMFFVLYSSYHFGEQQWTLFEKKKTNLSFLLYIKDFLNFKLVQLWWARQDSNLGPIHYECTALTN